MLHRANALSFTTESFNEECAKLRSIFSHFDYPSSLIDCVISNFDSRNPSVRVSERNESWVTDGTYCRAKFVQNLPLQHVLWSSTSWTPYDMWQRQILHKFHVARVKKCQRTREDVSLQHVPETRPGKFFTSVPTLLHVPATQPCNMSHQCVLNAILSPLHFAATCSCNMFLQHVPSCGPTLRIKKINIKEVRKTTLSQSQQKLSAKYRKSPIHPTKNACHTLTVLYLTPVTWTFSYFSDVFLFNILKSCQVSNTKEAMLYIIGSHVKKATCSQLWLPRVSRRTHRSP